MKLLWHNYWIATAALGFSWRRLLWYLAMAPLTVLYDGLGYVLRKFS